MVTDSTTIAITKKTAKTLKGLKLYPRETLNDVLTRVIKAHCERLAAKGKR